MHKSWDSGGELNGDPDGADHPDGTDRADRTDGLYSWDDLYDPDGLSDPDSLSDQVVRGVFRFQSHHVALVGFVAALLFFGLFSQQVILVIERGLQVFG